MTFLHVVYTACNYEGDVLYVGRTAWRRWAGWEDCQGDCVRRGRGEHRMCEHLMGRGRSFLWAPQVDFSAGSIWHRDPVAGGLSHRYVIGDDRCGRVERETVGRLDPEFNVHFKVAQ